MKQGKLSTTAHVQLVDLRFLNGFQDERHYLKVFTSMTFLFFFSSKRRTCIHKLATSISRSLNSRDSNDLPSPFEKPYSAAWRKIAEFPAFIYNLPNPIQKRPTN